MAEETKPEDTEAAKNERTTKSKQGFPKRYVIVIMLFLGLATQYALRVNINIAITAMCNNHTVKENGFTITKPAEFSWSSKLQGTILGSFFYGYIVLQIPGGYLAYRFGGTKVFGMSLLVGSLLTLLTPFVARTSVAALIALRVLEGVFLGVLFPCNHDILRKWAPASEKARLFAITVAGCPVGTIITMPLSGLLTKYGPDGWASAFYCFGGIGLCWSFIWLLIVHPNPDDHPTISEEEKEYILKDTRKNQTTNEKVPWCSIITSLPVWAVIIANFTVDWGLYTILICIPKYFVEILKFDIAKTGFVASLPYLVKAFVGPTGGLIVDLMIKNGMSVRNARRLIFTIGCTVAAIFVLAVGYSPNPIMAIAFLCIGVGITGVNATGYAVNLLDIAPRFAGVIMGITNVFGSLPGFLSPQIVGIITVNKTASEWRIVFWITFLVYMIGVVFFGALVSGDKQKWAMTPEELEALKKDEEGKEKDGKEKEGKEEEGKEEETQGEENKDEGQDGVTEDTSGSKEEPESKGETEETKTAENGETKGEEDGQTKSEDGGETTGEETKGEETKGEDSGETKGEDSGETKGKETKGEETKGEDSGETTGEETKGEDGGETKGEETKGEETKGEDGGATEEQQDEGTKDEQNGEDSETKE